jgi:hypothetical protein
MQAVLKKLARRRMLPSARLYTTLSDDAPRRFIRMGNPFLFFRVLQGRFELLAAHAGF